RVLLRERRQHIGREASAARAYLQNLAVGNLCEDLRELDGQRASEQRRQFRCRDEIPSSAELLCAASVIAEAGRVERGIHVVGEGNPTFLGGKRLHWAGYDARVG